MELLFKKANQEIKKLQGIIFLFIRRKWDVPRFIASFVMTSGFLSLPYIVTSGYVSSFLEFQSIKNDTEGFSYQVNTLGFSVGFGLVIVLLFGISVVYTYSNSNVSGVFSSLGLLISGVRVYYY